MSISTGSYTIRSALEPNPFIGGQSPRGNPPEDMKIVSLPRGGPRPTPQEWVIEKRGNNDYFLHAKGADTYIMKDLVWGTKRQRPRPEKWQIKRVPQHGKNQYLIMREKPKGHGWVLPGTRDNTQIAVRNLTGFQSSPQKFPARERFIIESLADLD